MLTRLVEFLITESHTSIHLKNEHNYPAVIGVTINFVSTYTDYLRYTVEPGLTDTSI